MKSYLKQRAVRLFIGFMRQSDVMREADRQFNLRNQTRPSLKNATTPYADMPSVHGPASRKPAIFVTSRFRSGSTLLWNIFRQFENCTSFYEPFNERRWFDPESRGDRVDSTHRGVDDYWAEYAELAHLGQWYDEEWIRQGLYMDARASNPAMQDYIDALIDAAQGTAVLQFNRVDLRLPWLRRTYPDVPIIHLYRHPRNQWVSFLTDPEDMSADRVVETYQDNFYLDVWCNDLSRHFPFLDPGITRHPYQRFYYLWKLSWLIGREHATASIAFENLVEQPKETLEPILASFEWQESVDWAQISRAIDPPAPDRWRSYAPAEWFAEHEAACERTLGQYFAFEETL